MSTKFVIDVASVTVDGEDIDLDYVRDAVDMGLDSFGMLLEDITHYDSYEEEEE